MIYILLSQAFFFLGGYVLQVFVGRTLGPELYGIFGLITAFLFIFERLIGGSLSRGISKFIAENEAASRSVIDYSNRIQLAFSLLVFIGFYLGAHLIADRLGDSSLTEYFRILSILIIVSGFYIIYGASLNGMRAFSKQALLTVAFAASRLFFVVGLVTLGYSLKGAVWGLVFAGIVCALLSRQYCKSLTGRGYFGKRDLIIYSLKVVVFTSAMLLIMNIDLIAVKIMLKNNYLTGLYNAVLNLARIPTLITFPLSIVLFPMIIKAMSENNTEQATDYANRLLRYLVIILVPFAFMVNVTSLELITLVYGKAYSEASSAFGVLIFGLTFVAITIAMNTVILAVHKLNVYILFNFLLVSTDIALNIVLIRKYGIIGASLATTVISFIACVFSIGYVFKHFDFTLRMRSLVNVFLSSIVVYIVASRFAFTGPIIVIYYLALYGLYFILLYLLREFNAQDLDIFRSLIPAKVMEKRT